MNGRFALLLLACTLFAAAWQGDDRGRRTDTRVAYRRHVSPTLYATRGSRARPTRIAVRGEWRVRGAQSVSDVVTRPTPHARPVATPAIAVVEATDVIAEISPATDLPLPVDIAAGEYRAVSNRGEVREVRLLHPPHGEHGPATDVTPRASYVVEADGVTWHFIRVETGVASAPPAIRSSAVPVPADGTAATANTAIAPATMLFTAGLRTLNDAVDDHVRAVRDATTTAIQRSSRRLLRATFATFGRVSTAMFPTDGTTRN